MVLLLGGIPFADERFSVTAWQEAKSRTKWRKAPVLITPQGREMSQSLAIAKCLAKQVRVDGYPLFPEDGDQAFFVEEMLALLEDIRHKLTSTCSIKNADQEREAVAKLFAPNGDCSVTLDKMDTLVGEGFMVGEILTLADIWAFFLFNFLRTGFWPGVPVDYLTYYPRLAAVVGKVGAIPKLKAYYEEMARQSPLYKSFTSAMPINLKALDQPALGEPIRMLFVVGELPFKDSGEITLGPLLPTPEGKEIARHVAKFVSYGGRTLLPEDSMKVFEVDDTLNLFDDLRNALAPTFALHDPAEQEEAVARLFQEDGQCAGLLQKLESFAGQRYTVGDALSLADIWVFFYLSFLQSGFWPGVPDDLLSRYPKLTTVLHSVNAVPRLRSYYRRKAEQNPAYECFVWPKDDQPQ